MYNLTQRIAALSPAKQAVLQREIVSRAPGTTSPVENGGSAPLSFSQQRLWFMEQWDPRSSTYSIPIGCRLTGPLNVEALGRSLNEIVRRHAILRTTFGIVDDEPTQTVGAVQVFDLSPVDLSDLPEGRREGETTRIMAEFVRRPFDLSKDLLIRARLLRLSRDEHIALLTIHHIACDGWSLGILFRELAALYEAFCDAKASPLPELPIQYADFAALQRRQLDHSLLQQHLSYWKNRLEGVTRLRFAATGARSVQPAQGATEPFLASRHLSEALKALSRREGVTPFTVFLATFYLLLHRYTEQDDLAIAVPVSGRNRSDVKDMMGFFVNTLILRANLSDDITFRELLARARRLTVEALAHQDAPLQNVVEILRRERVAGDAKMANVGFAFNAGLWKLRPLRGLSVRPIPLYDGTSKLDFTLFVHEGTDAFEGYVEYAVDRFDAGTIVRMLEDFRRLLEAATAEPHRRLAELAPTAGPALPRKSPNAPEEDERDEYARCNLTKNQLLMWLDQKLQPDTPLYNVPMAFTLSGAIDRDHFQRAFQTLVASSDALRTVVWEVDGVPQQEVVQDLPYEMEYLDFTEGMDPRGAFDEWARSRCQALFEPGRPLFDSVLAKISDREFVWYLNQHHIVTDGWSCQLMLGTMSEFYARSVEGRLERRVELPPFSDYVAFEKEHRRSARYREAEAYWNKKLAEKPEPLAFYGNPPLKRTSRVHRISRELGIERTRRLRRLAREGGIGPRAEQASIFALFTTLLSIYLYRITGNSRISIGTPFHNRRTEAFRKTLGLLMEVLPLQAAIEKNDTFASLLGKIRLEAAQMFGFSHAVGNSRNKGLYDVVLNYHPASFSEFHGMAVHQQWLHTGYENDSLALQVYDVAATGFRLHFDFHADVFDEGQRYRAVDHFVHLLDEVLENPRQSVDRLNLLPEEERERILVDFNRTQRAWSDELDLARLFETQAEKLPTQPAVVSENQSLTYGQLNSRANQLGHYLKSLGVGPETVVAICMERSLEAVIAVLGILKAGGAYLPIDPSSPPERLKFMLDDAAVKVILTEEKLGLLEDAESKTANNDLRSSAPVLRDVEGLDPRMRIVYVDRARERIARESQKTPIRETTPDNLAYVIYTSGSTGNPKAVMIPHRGICNRLLWGQETYQLTEADRLLHAMSLSFDFATWEIFTALVGGAALILARPDRHRDSDYLVDLIAENGITVAGFVPSMLEAILHEPGIETCRSLKKVMAGAEMLSTSLHKRFQVRLAAELQNTYGPTEASIDVTCWICPAEPGAWSNGRSVPIGRPIANTRIYLLDSSFHPVPVGVPGELYIGGAGLARGYLNRPELTAEKFIANPFSTQPGERLYRTGDLARYLPDGNIEFLGRLDRQIKIRGFRVELGEIEAALRQHPAVRDAVVSPVDEVVSQENQNPKSENKRLVAYAVPNTDYQQRKQAEDREAEHISEWQSLYDDSYGQIVSEADLTFNTVGWNSSYTGRPIPAEEMREWVDETTKRILSLQPRRVLEIGCGTGLLLFRVAPHCTRYVGTDFSPVALRMVERQIANSRIGDCSVELLERMADDFRDIEPESFDTVILNSVIQYFPDIDYLVRVLEGAVRAVKPGGAIFLGDIRSMSLLRAFHASVQLHQASPSLGREELRRRVNKRVAEEKELVLDPEFFTAFKHHFPTITQVRVQPKRGRHHNELTKFRYDVILALGGNAAPAWDTPALDWRKEGLTLPTLRRLLVETGPQILRFSGVPNARTLKDVEIVKWLESAAEPDTAGQLRGQSWETANGGIDPAQVWALSEELPYVVDIYDANSNDGSYEVILRRSSGTNADPVAGAADLPHAAVASLKPWAAYANNPIQGKLSDALVAHLRDFLKEKLPNYMLPSAFVLLDAFPLTSTGKVDHRSLPVPDQIRPELKQVFVAPRTEIEKALAEIWAKVLKLQQIGIHDSFFDLGGHSLLATRVVSRIRSLFDADLTLRAFFERPTVADLAATIAQNVAEKTDLEEITRALRDIQALSNEETARQLAEETRSSEQSPPADSE